jgi:DNA-binding transcriptional ArsR family regulator
MTNTSINTNVYDKVFTALADPTRRGIFEALARHPQSVGELAKHQPVSRPAVSQHLKALQNARLVSVEPRGNRHVYSIKQEGLMALRQYLDGFWSDALFAFGAEITRKMENNKEK